MICRACRHTDDPVVEGIWAVASPFIEVGIVPQYVFKGYDVGVQPPEASTLVIGHKLWACPNCGIVMIDVSRKPDEIPH